MIRVYSPEYLSKGVLRLTRVGMKQLQTGHKVADSPADAIAQYYNAGGMVQFYDYPLYELLGSTKELISNDTVKEDLLKDKVRKVLGVKYDLGLFDNPYIADEVDPY